VYTVPGRPDFAPTTTVQQADRAISHAQSDTLGGHGPFVQVAATYIVRALDDGFEIVDQHALHERIQFEGLLAEMRAGGIETQRLLVPELVEVSRAEAAALGAHFEALARIGIELSAFGETTIAVQGLPARLARPRTEAIVRDTLAVIEEARDIDAARILEDVLHRAACRSSVMAGDVLTEPEIRSLLERGRHLESDQTCVHGRPTRVRFTLGDLERAFERR
jgi:DNA mismatch repair protein MutL